MEKGFGRMFGLVIALENRFPLLYRLVETHIASISSFRSNEMSLGLGISLGISVFLETLMIGN